MSAFTLLRRVRHRVVPSPAQNAENGVCERLTPAKADKRSIRRHGSRRAALPAFRGLAPHIRGLDPHFQGLDLQMRGSDPHFRGLDPQMRGSDPHFRSLGPQMRGLDPHFRGLAPQMRGSDLQFRGPDPQMRGVDRWTLSSEAHTLRYKGGNAGVPPAPSRRHSEGRH
jgi:hypothetical protein